MNAQHDRHRSSSPFRVIVVGAGIVGLCVAWHLAKRGASVTIFDPNPPGSGCSSGNAGAISAGSVVPLAMPGLLRSVPGMLLNPNAPLHIPARYWLKAMPWLLQFVGSARPNRVAAIAEALSHLHHSAIERHREILVELNAPELMGTNGQLYVYRTNAQLKKDDRIWALRRHHGVRIERIDRATIEALEPGISGNYTIGMFLPDQGMSLNPLRQATVIADGLRQRGATFVTEGVKRLTIQGHEVVGVETATRSFSADRVVLAAGAWSTTLLEPLGYRIPLESQRGYHVDLPQAGVNPQRTIVAADRKVFISPMETGLRVAGTVEFGGVDAPPSWRRAELLLNDLAQVFPTAHTDSHDPFWMGHRPCLPDSLPILGESERHGNLWFAFGHGHLGLTQSAVSGDLVARGIFKELANIDMGPYSAERFGSGLPNSRRA